MMMSLAVFFRETGAKAAFVLEASRGLYHLHLPDPSPELELEVIAIRV